MSCAWLMTFLKILTTYDAPHLSRTRRGVDNGGKQHKTFLSPNFSGYIKLDAKICKCICGGLGKPKIESSAFSALT